MGQMSVEVCVCVVIFVPRIKFSLVDRITSLAMETDGSGMSILSTMSKTQFLPVYQ